MDVNWNANSICLLIFIMDPVLFTILMKKEEMKSSYVSIIIRTKFVIGKKWIYRISFIFIILRFNGTVFDQLHFNTQHGHTRAGNSLGVYNGNAIVIGGRDRSSSSSTIYHNEVEVLEFEIGRLKWNLKNKYPYHSR